MRLTLGECNIDLDRLRIHRGTEIVDLSPKEGEVLRYFVGRPGTLVSKRDLERRIWGFADGVQSQTVPVCVRRLRSKLGAEARFLQTVRGRGWRFVIQEPRRSRYRDTFVGRAEELESVNRRLGDGPVVLVGPAGIGKTRLAHQASLDRGTIWIEPAGAPWTDAVADALGVARQAATPDALADALAERRPDRLVLDGHEAPLREGVGDWVLSTGAEVLLTARTWRDDVVEPIEIGGMSVEDARALLIQRGQRNCPSLDARDPALRQLALHLQGRPDVIEWVAGMFRLYSPSDTLRLLERPGESPLRAVARHTWPHQPPHIQRLLSLLAPLPAGAAGWLLDALAPATEQELLALHDGAWVQRREDRLFVTAGARRALTTTDEDWLLLAEAFAQQFPLVVGPSAERDFEDYLAEQRNIEWLVAHAPSPAPDALASLLRIEGRILVKHGPLQSELLDEGVAKLAHPDTEEAVVVDLLRAEMAHLRGETPDCRALARQSLSRVSGPRAALVDGWAKLLVGRSHIDRGEWESAEEALRSIDPTCETVPDLWGAVQLARGVAHRANGQYAVAQELYRACLVTFEGDADRLLSVRHNLAACLVADGRAGQAEIEAREALRLAEESSSELPRARSLALLGRILIELGQASEARQRLDAAEAIARPAGIAPLLVLIELERTRMELDTGDPAVAETLMVEGYHRTSSLKGGAYHPAVPLGNLAICQALLGKHERAQSNIAQCQAFLLEHRYISDSEHYFPFAWLLLGELTDVDALSERLDALRYPNAVVRGLVREICAARGWPSPCRQPGSALAESTWVRLVRRLLDRPDRP